MKLKTCPICGHECKQLFRHSDKFHKEYSKEEILAKYLGYDNVPKCKVPGCNNNCRAFYSHLYFGNYCEEHSGFGSNFKYMDGFNKAKMYEKRVATFRLNGRPNTNKGKHIVIHDRSKFERQSATMKKQYLNGERSVIDNFRKSKFGYVKTDNKVFCYRSSYEFIYLIYLLENEFKFEYESIRLHSDKYDKTYICDFYLPESNEIVEIKGNPNFDVEDAKFVFESSGYKYKIYFWDTLISDIVPKIKCNIWEFYDKIISTNEKLTFDFNKLEFIN